MKKLLFLFFFVLNTSARAQVVLFENLPTLTDTKQIAMRDEIERQRQWFANQTVSTMTFRRMKRELSKLAIWPENPNAGIKKRYLETSPPPDSVIWEELFQRQRRILNAKYNLIIQDLDWKNYKIFVGEVEDTASYMGIYMSRRDTFARNLETGEILERTPTLWDPEPGDFAIKSFFYSSSSPTFLGTPTHELSHVSVDGNKFIYEETMKILYLLVNPDTLSLPKIRNIRAGTTYTYYDNPTEIKARLDCVRYILFCAGIYDATKEDFTSKHLRRLLRNEEVMQENSIQNLLFGRTDMNYFLYPILKNKKHLIWLMNNIA